MARVGVTAGTVGFCALAGASVAWPTLDGILCVALGGGAVLGLAWTAWLIFTNGYEINIEAWRSRENIGKRPTPRTEQTVAAAEEQQ